MSMTREHTRTELRLAEVQALAESLDQLGRELATYREVLLLQLEGLRQEIAAEQASPVPARSQPPVRTRPTIQGDAMPMVEDRPAVEVRDSLRRGLESSADASVEEPATEAPAIPASSGIHSRQAVAHAVPAPRRAAPPPAPPEPTRKSDSGTRKGGKPVSILIAQDTFDGDRESIAGWVLERSANTLRLLVDDQLVVGTVYSIRPAKDHPNAQWVQISIKSCHPERGSFAVVAQFVERPPWTALSLL
jgi:hypothetical protein